MLPYIAAQCPDHLGIAVWTVEAASEQSAQMLLQSMANKNASCKVNELLFSHNASLLLMFCTQDCADVIH